MTKEHIFESEETTLDNRRKANERILTGRRNGQFYQNGESRGGTRRYIIEFTRFVPDPLKTEEVFRVQGIVDREQRIPYEKLHPAVKEVRLRRTVTTDQWGNSLGYQDEELRD